MRGVSRRLPVPAASSWVAEETAEERVRKREALIADLRRNPPTEDEASRDALIQKLTDPASLHVLAPGVQEHALRSTMRGIVYMSCGNQFGKTTTLAYKSYLVASDQHWKYACPPDCPQWMQGSCGVHCCPQPKYGSADFAQKGCVAGRAVPCPIHPALRYTAPRKIIIGAPNLTLLWENFYADTLVNFLPKNLDGSPTWKEDRKTNRIIAADGSWIYAFLPYDELSRWKGHRACFVGLDELPESRDIFIEAQTRANTLGAQIFIAATAVELLKGKGLWILDLARRRHDPRTRVQVLEGSTMENVFTDRERLIEMSHAWTDQERDVKLHGRLTYRQDASVFNQEIIDIQSRFVRQPEAWWVCGAPVDSIPTSAYFKGVTTYPQGCTLPPFIRGDIEARRMEGGNGGTACYDCPPERHCPAYKPPPRAGFEARGALRPTLQRGKPADAAIERHRVNVWAEPDPKDRYVLGCDTAGGTGRDFCVATVLSQMTGEQVLQFRDRTQPHVLAAILAAIYDRYKPFMVVERNGYGAEVLQRIETDYGIPAGSIFYRRDMSVRSPAGTSHALAGYITTAGSKSLETPFGRARSPLESLRYNLRARRIIIRSVESVNEYQTFIRHKDGKLGALEGCHDDCVIADMLAAFALEHQSQFALQVMPMDDDAGPAKRADPSDCDYIDLDEMFGANGRDQPWEVHGRR